MCSCRPQMGPMLVPWTLLSGTLFVDGLFNLILSSCLAFIVCNPHSRANEEFHAIVNLFSVVRGAACPKWCVCKISLIFLPFSTEFIYGDMKLYLNLLSRQIPRHGNYPSIPRLIMTWRCKEPWRQQPWYWYISPGISQRHGDDDDNNAKVLTILNVNSLSSTRLQLPVPSDCWVMVQNATIYWDILKAIQHIKGWIYLTR